MKTVKITHGYVKQVFDKRGNLIRQEFKAGDDVEWEDENGNQIDPKDFYHPFTME